MLNLFLDNLWSVNKNKKMNNYKQYFQNIVK